MPYPEGIDASNNNGHVDWDAVAASGRTFAFVKSTGGVAFRDAFFAHNWSELKRLGLARGSYHFGRPSVNSPEDEAAFYMAIASEQGIEDGDMLALDLEDPDASGSLADWTLRFLQRVETLAGFAPLLYTSPGFIVDHMLQRTPELARFGLWCASWGVPTPPQAPPPWDLVAFHQYGVGGAGSVPGVAGQCDLNRFNGPVEHIRLYGKPGADPIPAPPDQSATIAALQAQVAALTQQRDGLIVTVADLSDRLGDQLAGYAAAISSTVDQMRAERGQAIGPRP